MRKLTKSEYTPAEVRQELANLLQEKIDTYGSELRKLREREVGRAALAKGDLCLLCAQLPGKCVCMSTLKKHLPFGASSSAGAQRAADKTNQRPFMGHAHNDVEGVNRELAGMKSVGSSPTHGGGSLTNAPKTAPKAGNGNRAASGVIPNAKAEPTTSKKFKIPGKGGKLKKHVATPPTADARPAPSGIPGKQPVGQGGGDGFKVPKAISAMGANDVKATAPSAANATKDKAALPKPAAAAMPKAGVHPTTQAGLGAVPSPKAAWKGQGLPSLKSKLQNVQAAHALAPKPLPSVDVDVSDFAQKPAAAPAARAARPAAAPALGARQQLAADKRAGGVGFLNNLISRFRRQPAAAPAAAAPVAAAPAAAAPTAAPVQSKRFHGVTALQRSEPDAKKSKKAFALDKCAMCRKSEHTGMCKEEMPAPTEGLSSINHNRTMLRVGQSGQRKKNKR